jgi:hypothetical protein
VVDQARLVRYCCGGILGMFLEPVFGVDFSNDAVFDRYLQYQLSG